MLARLLPPAGSVSTSSTVNFIYMQMNTKIKIYGSLSGNSDLATSDILVMYF